METLWQWHGNGGPTALLALALFFALMIVILAVWVALPFAIFGTKSLLRDLLAAQRETNRKLEEIEKALSEQDRWRPADWHIDEDL